MHRFLLRPSCSSRQRLQISDRGRRPFGTRTSSQLRSRKKYPDALDDQNKKEDEAFVGVKRSIFTSSEIKFFANQHREEIHAQEGRNKDSAAGVHPEVVVLSNRQQRGPSDTHHIPKLDTTSTPKNHSYSRYNNHHAPVESRRSATSRTPLHVHEAFHPDTGANTVQEYFDRLVHEAITTRCPVQVQFIRTVPLYSMLRSVDANFGVDTTCRGMPFPYLIRSCPYLSIVEGKIHFERMYRKLKKKERRVVGDEGEDNKVTDDEVDEIVEHDGEEACRLGLAVPCGLRKYRFKVPKPMDDGVRSSPKPWLYSYDMISLTDTRNQRKREYK